MARQIISASRFLIIIAVIAIFLIATALLIYGAAETYALIAGLFGSAADKGSKTLLLGSIELVDLFLLATVLYVIAVGLYELFIDDRLPLPTWLEIRTLDDLKDKLIGVVVVVMAVLFLGQLISWDGQRELLGYGAAVALVIAALTYFTGQKKSKPVKTEKDGTNEH